MPAGSAPHPPWLLPAAAAALAVGALASSNPGPQEFEAFAGERLVDLISGEICRGGSLPLALHLVLHDCPRLVHSQRPLLGRLAAEATQRTNFGLFSLYVTELGGQDVLPGLRLPRLQAITLAGAGQLAVLRASSDNGLRER